LFPQDRLSKSNLEIKIKVINYPILWINDEGIKPKKEALSQSNVKKRASSSIGYFRTDNQSIKPPFKVK